MGNTTIEWTDASWNPIVGCTEVSPGCANCYAARLAATRLKNHADYQGLSRRGVVQPRVVPHWTGQVRFLPERLEEPLHWKTPRRIFVCDMGDLFHEAVEEEWLHSIFWVVLSCARHTFQILTKRPTRMKDFMTKYYSSKVAGLDKPLENVWLGVSVENQHFADERIPLLLNTPATVRWISAEPLLGPVEVSKWFNLLVPNLQWVVCGGESGPNARPMHPDWARSLRAQCRLADVPFFFKQWGEWVEPSQAVCSLHSGGIHDYVSDGKEHSEGCPNAKLFMIKCGKKQSGRLLDGREWNEFPSLNK